eukprot:118852-Ditylum_brightwellii.AAC.1
MILKSGNVIIEVRAKEEKIDLSIMCFRRFQENFECVVFRTRLYQVLLNVLNNRKKRQGTKAGGDTLQEDECQLKKKKGGTVKNAKLNPAWALKENKSYSTLLHMGIHKGR